MKTFKMMGFGPRKSKSGFTLIELLIVMVIIAILAGVIVMAVTGVFGGAKSAAYNTEREQLQNAVAAYSANNSAAIPYAGTGVQSTYNVSANITAGQAYVINVSMLLISQGGMLRSMPTGMYATSTVGMDNCGGGSGNDTAYGCTSSGHYVWLMDSSGTVYSVCISGGGGTCTAGNTTGYQGVWP
jgi:prepilin-type N-terminal cleavage/methylation domain-containing protein